MFDFIKELVSALKSTAIDRVKNPFIGAFSFSWLAFNWRSILVVLFSEKNIEDKIAWVNQNSDLIHAVLYPAILSGVILGVLPLVSALVMWTQERPLGFVMKKYMERDEQTLDRKIGVEKKRALASIAFKRVVAGEELEIQGLNAQVQASKDISEKLTIQMDSLKDENKKLHQENKDLKAKNEGFVMMTEGSLKTSIALNQQLDKNLEMQKTIQKLRSEMRLLKENQKPIDLKGNYLKGLSALEELSIRTESIDGQKK